MDLCSPALSPMNHNAGRMNPARRDTGATSHKELCQSGGTAHGIRLC